MVHGSWQERLTIPASLQQKVLTSDHSICEDSQNGLHAELLSGGMAMRVCVRDNVEGSEKQMHTKSPFGTWLEILRLPFSGCLKNQNETATGSGGPNATLRHHVSLNSENRENQRRPSCRAYAWAKVP